MGRIRNALAALVAPSMEATSSRYGPSDGMSSDGWFVRMLGGGKTKAGVAVSEYSAIYLPIVYACVNRIGNPVGNFPVEIRQPNGTGGSVKVTEHPMSQRIGLRPNDYMSSRTLRKTTQGHALLWGNGYQEIERNQKGEAVGLWPLLPDRTRPHRVDGQLEYRTTIDGRTFRIDHGDVAHVMTMNQILALEDQNGIGAEGDVNFVSNNVQTLKNAIAGKPAPGAPDAGGGAEGAFVVGDIVSRDGSDRQIVLAVGEWGDITVKCVEPSAHGWCQAGDIENNLADRYRRVEELAE